MTFNQPLPGAMQTWAEGGSTSANYANLTLRHGANDPAPPACTDETCSTPRRRGASRVGC